MTLLGGPPQTSKSPLTLGCGDIRLALLPWPQTSRRSCKPMKLGRGWLWNVHPALLWWSSEEPQEGDKQTSVFDKLVYSLKVTN